ncbi:MAG: beta-propeller domain-containing protein [Candidatus Woesearchaeota archaeon]
MKKTINSIIPKKPIISISLFSFALIAILLSGLLLPASGCTKSQYQPRQVPSAYYDQAGLFPAKFSSVAELQSFLKKYQNQPYYSRGMFGAMTDGMVVTKHSIQPAGQEMTISSRNDFSGTNVQVQGIDEGDIIKTDGEYIYTISGNTLFLVKAYPGQDAAIVSQVGIEFTPQGLFVSGNRLAVFGNTYDNKVFQGSVIRPTTGMMQILVYDISNKEKPKLIKSYAMEGSYKESRMIGNNVYFVTITYPQQRNPLPLVMDGTALSTIPVDRITYFPKPYSMPSYAILGSINLASAGTITTQAIIIEGNTIFYMAPEALYLSFTEYINEWEIEQSILVKQMMQYLTAEEKRLIAKIENTDDDVMSPFEKQVKIRQIVETAMLYLSEEERKDVEKAVEEKAMKELEKYPYQEYTAIHKIAVSGNDFTLVANGKIPGRANNQFSFDEYEGVLRVATTLTKNWRLKSIAAPEQQAANADDQEENSIVEPDGGLEERSALLIAPPRWQQDTSNAVFTLDDQLQVLDSLIGIAPGEMIYASRFMGEKLYLVTFRQVDPFFVVDLSNPKKITLLGELKIPGFSRYLHPYDETTIIGIGRDATLDGRVKGLKISLFDVSNVHKPKEIATYVTDDGYAQSTAEYEHKAFLFSKEKQLLVIPAYSYQWKNNAYEEVYNGAMVFHVAKDSIRLRGIIDHSDGNIFSGTSMERSLYINELLYTKSPTKLRINKIEDLQPVKTIIFENIWKREGGIAIY